MVPDLTGLDRQFDYVVPDEWRQLVAVGTLVRVPLNGRRVGGWVASLHAQDPVATPPTTSHPGGTGLLPLAKVTGVGPSQEIFDLAAWASRRWSGPLRPFLVTASPPGAVAHLPPARYGGPVPEPVDGAAGALLSRGGGLLRHPPCADILPVVLAACRLGPTLVVAPSVYAAGMLGARLRRAGRTVAVVPREWAFAAGGVDVVVGARAAVWAPGRDLRSIVVLDEHDEAMQEQRQPTWHARDVAVRRARLLGIPALLVSPCPSAAAVAAVAVDAFVRPTVADERAGWPIVEIVDRTRDEPWQKSLMTSALIRQLRDHNRTVVCVLNAIGRGKLMACRTCRAIQRCEVCEAAVRQDDDRRFACPRCGVVRPPVCQACGGAGFANLRVGVTRLREEVEAAAGRRVVLVSARDDDSDAVVAGGVYVGTEAVLHRVHRADTVAFVDFDAELLAPRYRATEQAMTLLARAARLVGGRGAGGRLIVQTFLPRHDVLDAVLHADPGRLMARELARRRELGFPPSTAIAVVSGAGAEAFAEQLAAPDVQATLDLSGNVLLRARSWDALAGVLAASPRPKGSRLRIEVDPPRL